MPALKQSDTPNSAQKVYRAAASETAAKNRSNGNIKAVDSVPGMAIQRQLAVQKKPGEGEELPVQPKFYDTGVNTSLQAFHPKQQTLTSSGTANKVPFIQAKLTINAPGDQYEQEADTMADKVMRMPANGLPFSPTSSAILPIQRRHSEREDDEKVHRKETSSQPTEAGSDVSSYVGSLSSKGSPMPLGTKSFFEVRFGRDFSDVKIHNDGVAAKSAQSINALAYTSGNNIVFNQNQFSPETDSGKRLLAHELTHVVQQNAGSGKGIQKWDSDEHVKMGDEAGKAVSGYILLESYKRDLPNRLDPVDKWPPTMRELHNKGTDGQKAFLKEGLTYGQVLALSGDFYKTFADLNNAPLREIYELIPLILISKVSRGLLQAATGGRFMALAEKNQPHYSAGTTNNMATWRQGHIEAITVAKSNNANLAYGINAAADHFLTDRFSGGHLLTERNSNRQGIGIMARVAAGVFGEKGDMDKLSALMDHDIDNANGVAVTNLNKKKWVAYGDNKWESGENTENRKYALDATKSSVSDIQNAISQGSSYPTPDENTVFEAEKIVPIVDKDATKSIVPHTKAVRKAMFKQINNENKLTDVIKERYFDGDNIVRAWVARMDDAAIRWLPIDEKKRMSKEVLTGWFSDDDFATFRRIYDNSTAAERVEIDKVVAKHGRRRVKKWIKSY